MARRPLIVLGAAGAVIGLALLVRPPPHRLPPAPPPVLHDGCAGVIGDACRLGDGPVTLFVAEEPARLTVDGASGHFEAVDGGWRARVLGERVRIDFADGSAWAMSMVPRGEAVARATACRAEARDADDLARCLDAAEQDLAATPDDAALRSAAARLAWALAAETGDPGRRARALALLEEAADAHEADGDLLGAARDRAMLVQVHWILPGADPTAPDARRALDRLRDVEVVALDRGSPDPALGAAEIPFQLAFADGSFARSTGDARHALERFELALSVAERVDRSDFADHARAELAHTLQGMGRHDAALERLARLVDGDTLDRAACDDPEDLMSYAWAAWEALQDGRQVHADVRGALRAGTAEQVAALHRALVDRAGDDRAPPTEACARLDPYNRSLLHLNHAIAAATAGLEDEARAALIASGFDPSLPDDALPRDGVSVWQQLVLAALAPPEEALAAFDRAAGLAEGLGLVPETLRALRGRARSLHALGQDDEALATLQRAEALLGEESRRLPVHAGLRTWLEDQTPLVREHVALLLALDRPEDALDRARRHRVAYLRLIGQLSRTEHSMDRYRRAADEARARRAALWTVPEADRAEAEAAVAALEEDSSLALDEALTAAPTPEADLPPIPDGVLLLALFTLPEGGVGFAADADGVRALPLAIDPAAPETLGDALLAPFADAILASDEIWLLADVGLDGLDLQALPFQGRPLGLVRPVSRPLDLGGEAPGPVKRVVVVSDPREDLADARAEGAAVVGAWEGHGVAVQALSGPAATREALVGGPRGCVAPDADLLHIAAHGSNGDDGWSAAIQLAGDDALGSGEVLAAGCVPPVVVLTACRSAAAEPSLVEPLGMDRAFVAAGALEAIASRGDLDGAVAVRFAEAWHQQRANGVAPAEAWRAALEAVADDPGWRQLRRVVR